MFIFFHVFRLVEDGIVSARNGFDSVVLLIDAAKDVIGKEHGGDVVFGLFLIIEIADGDDGAVVVKNDVFDVERTDAILPLVEVADTNFERLDTYVLGATHNHHEMFGIGIVQVRSGFLHFRLVATFLAVDVVQHKADMVFVIDLLQYLLCKWSDAVAGIGAYEAV